MEKPFVTVFSQDRQDSYELQSSKLMCGKTKNSDGTWGITIFYKKDDKNIEELAKYPEPTEALEAMDKLLRAITSGDDEFVFPEPVMTDNGLGITNGAYTPKGKDTITIQMTKKQREITALAISDIFLSDKYSAEEKAEACGVQRALYNEPWDEGDEASMKNFIKQLDSGDAPI